MNSYGLRTNNWGDYGGMDVYTKQIAGSSNHDVFYTNSAVQVGTISSLGLERQAH
jgi:hypothetical protein